MFAKTPEDYYALVGKATLLWVASGYRVLSLPAMASRITKPLLRGHALVLSNKDGAPAAFVSWAFRPEEAPILNILDVLTSEEAWNCGPSMHIVDFIAPFGGVSTIVRRLKLESLSAYPEAKSWLGWRSRLRSPRNNPVKFNLGVSNHGG